MTTFPAELLPITVLGGGGWIAAAAIASMHGSLYIEVDLVVKAQQRVLVDGQGTPMEQRCAITP